MVAPTRIADLAARAMTTAATQHLLLRPWGEPDRAELERLFSDPAVRGGRKFGPIVSPGWPNTVSDNGV
jgi:hypothetical protein